MLSVTEGVSQGATRCRHAAGRGADCDMSAWAAAPNARRRDSLSLQLFLCSLDGRRWLGDGDRFRACSGATAEDLHNLDHPQHDGAEPDVTTVSVERVLTRSLGGIKAPTAATSRCTTVHIPLGAIALCATSVTGSTAWRPQISQEDHNQVMIKIPHL